MTLLFAGLSLLLQTTAPLPAAPALAPAPFGVGESLVFKGKFNLFRPCCATLSVEAIDTVRGVPSYRFSFNSKISILGIFTLIRWIRTLIAKITGRPPPADATALTPAAFARFDSPRRRRSMRSVYSASFAASRSSGASGGKPLTGVNPGAAIAHRSWTRVSPVTQSGKACQHLPGTSWHALAGHPSADWHGNDTNSIGVRSPLQRANRTSFRTRLRVTTRFAAWAQPSRRATSHHADNTPLADFSAPAGVPFASPAECDCEGR